MGLIADFSFLKKNIPKKSDKTANSAANQNSVSQSKTGKMESIFPRRAFKPLRKKKITLTSEQKICVQKILKSGTFAVHLIYGVTGSGKTEIYKELVSHVLQKGRQALILLPEISLTPQLVRRFSETFLDETALLHSQISEKQKRTVWEDINTGKKNLLIGTRSALFCPLPRLGIIIVDEEHDSSFKQDDNFCYHARDSAIVLAQKAKIPIALGSATPNFSSYKNALNGAYKLYELKSRPAQTRLPKVHIVDLRTKPSEGRPFWLSDTLFNKIHNTVQRGRQTALFLNRRGQAGALICSQCGHVQKCQNCDISLRLHKDSLLLCHYCSYLEKKPERCPVCKSVIWLEKGIGVQKVQESLEKLFPDYKIF